VEEDFAVWEIGEFVDEAGGFDLFVAAVVVKRTGGDVGSTLFAELVLELAPLAAVDFRVLSDGITGQEGVGGIGKVGGGGEVTTVEAGVGESFGWARASLARGLCASAFLGLALLTVWESGRSRGRAGFGCRSKRCSLGARLGWRDSR